MKYLPKPCFRKALILFSLLIVSGKQHFHLCLLSSSDLIFFFIFWYKVTVGKKGQKIMLKVKGGTSEFSAVYWSLHRFDAAATKQKW